MIKNFAQMRTQDPRIIKDGALYDIVNGFPPLINSTMNSILDVLGILDTPLLLIR